VLCGWLPLDVDAFAMDNGDTIKEGVGRTKRSTRESSAASV
jgi:hypothetical protein